jgi:hypothetical protein
VTSLSYSACITSEAFMRSPALERRVPRLQPVHRSAAHVLTRFDVRRLPRTGSAFGGKNAASLV